VRASLAQASASLTPVRASSTTARVNSPTAQASSAPRGPMAVARRVVPGGSTGGGPASSCGVSAAPTELPAARSCRRAALCAGVAGRAGSHPRRLAGEDALAARRAPSPAGRWERRAPASLGGVRPRRSRR
jgi:hypothetical protein